MRSLTVSPENENRRLDKYLLKYLNKAPKSFVYKMLRKKNIVLNGARALGSELLNEGDVIALYISDGVLDGFMEERAIKKTSKDINIIYEDENILICDKPAGVLSHPGRMGEQSAKRTTSPGRGGSSQQDTMIDRILYYLNKTGQLDASKSSVFTPALCGRLDRNTSGLLICGKNYRAMQSLNKAVAEDRIGRYYTALVSGKVNSGILRGWHVKNEETNEVIISDTKLGDAKEAITEYRAIKTYGGYTLVEVKLVTGRSHQIRAHFQSIGCPIVGDRKYGSVGEESSVSSQLLHCGRIRFEEEIPNLEYLHGREFVSPRPERFSKFFGF